MVETNEFRDIEQRLVSFSSDEAEFVRLQGEVGQAAKILEAYIARAAEAQTNADLETSEQLSRVKVVQSPTVPIEPVFPPKPLFLTLGAVIGLLAGAAAAVAKEMTRKKSIRTVVLPQQDVAASNALRLRTTRASQ